MIRKYIQHQEKADEKLEQLGLWRYVGTVKVAQKVEAA